MKNWIQKAIKKPGALTKSAKAAGMSPMAFAKAHAKDSGKTGARARLALMLQSFQHHKGKSSEHKGSSKTSTLPHAGHPGK